MNCGDTKSVYNECNSLYSRLYSIYSSENDSFGELVCVQKASNYGEWGKLSED